ncbi:hypothetical protein Acid7E03_35380 [Acidisoma sp. 7E03]
MTAEIINLDGRRPPVMGHRFECLGCASQVYSAVHFGNQRLCRMCQQFGPKLSRTLQEALSHALQEGTLP